LLEFYLYLLWLTHTYETVLTQSRAKATIVTDSKERHQRNNKERKVAGYFQSKTAKTRHHCRLLSFKEYCRAMKLSHSHGILLVFAALAASTYRYDQIKRKIERQEAISEGRRRLKGGALVRVDQIISIEKKAPSSRPLKGRIPNFLLAGAQKAGTSATAAYLFRRRGAVCGPRARQEPGMSYTGKEAHFFDEDDQVNKGLEHYQGLFDHCGNSPIIMDATPGYMLYPERIRKMYEEHGTADTVKIMFTLREPVSRDISWYEQLVREYRHRLPLDWVKVVEEGDGNVKTFENYTESIILPSIRGTYPSNRGLYAHWLKRWFELFDRKQIWVVNYDDFKANQTDFLERLHEFLELPVKGPLNAPRSNSKHVKTPPLTCSVQKMLAKEFEQHNKDLYKLLEDNPGPPMEKRPFTKFNFHCKDENAEANTIV